MRRRAAWAAAGVVLVCALVGGTAWLGKFFATSGVDSKIQSAQSAEVAAGANAQEKQEVARDIERELKRGFNEFHSAVSELPSGSYFFHQDAGQWERNLTSLERELDQMEGEARQGMKSED